MPKGMCWTAVAAGGLIIHPESKTGDMKYSNICGPDFFPRPKKGYSVKAKVTAAAIPSKVKQDMEPPRVVRTPQHQNWALVNTSPELTQPCAKAQVRISFLQVKKVEEVQAAKGKPVKSDSRKRIEKMQKQHQKKLSLHQMFLEGKVMA